MSNVAKGLVLGLVLAVLVPVSIFVPHYFFERPTARTISIVLKFLIGVAVAFSVTRWQRAQKEKRARPEDPN